MLPSYKMKSVPRLSPWTASDFQLKAKAKDTGGILWKKVFLKIGRPATLLKNRLQRRYFPVNFVIFLGAAFYRTAPVDLFLTLSKNAAIRFGQFIALQFFLTQFIPLVSFYTPWYHEKETSPMKYVKQTQPAFKCLKLTIETLEQGVKYV